LPAFASLATRLAGRELVIGVVGLGYVGITTAAAFAGAGFRVIGTDRNADRIATLQRGGPPFVPFEPALADLITRAVTEKKLAFADAIDALAYADVALVCVETPVDAHDHVPRFEALSSASLALGAVLKRGALVIVESTLAPRCMQTTVIPALEQASGLTHLKDFSVGHCPQRVMPGKLLSNLQSMPRVCGGDTAQTAQFMAKLYSTITSGQCHATDILTAEIVKTAENTYRDIKIAFANELGRICESAGADFHQIRELMLQPDPQKEHHVLLPGAGVGGHCIPKDPWLLLHGSPAHTGELLRAARAVNDSMPLHIARVLEEALSEAKLALADARVVILGYAYLENTSETRGSPSELLVQHLSSKVSSLVVHDPWVHAFNTAIDEGLADADAVVVMVAHDVYRTMDLTRIASALRTRILIDGRNVFDLSKAMRAGFIVRAIGKGVPATSDDACTSLTSVMMTPHDQANKSV